MTVPAVCSLTWETLLGMCVGVFFWGGGGRGSGGGGGEGCGGGRGRRGEERKNESLRKTASNHNLLYCCTLTLSILNILAVAAVATHAHRICAHTSAAVLHTTHTAVIHTDI